MAFQFDPYALIPLGAGVISLALALFIWSRRPGRGVLPFTLLMIAVATWVFSSGMEILSVDAVTKNVFVVLSYIGIALVPPIWLIFVLEYIGQDTWITRRRVLLLAIHPVLLLLAIFSNPWHQAFWVNVRLDPVLLVNEYTYGTLFWVHAAYAYVLLLFANALLIHAFIRTPHLYRGQIVLLTAAQCLPWLANGIFILGLSPLPAYVDLSALGFTATGIIVAYSLYRFKLMDLTPVAHYAVFNSMSDAVFVFDLKQRIVDVNPAGLALLGISATAALGKGAAEVFAGQPALVNDYLHLEDAAAEIRLQAHSEPAPRTYQMRLSALRDRSGALTGRTVVLHDITELERTNRELNAARIKANESARLKSEFLATISHELRTPLNIILGYVEVLKMGVLGEVEEQQRQPLDRIETSGQQLLSMITDILDLSKIEAGHVHLEMSPLNLHGLALEWQTAVSVLAEQRGLSLSTDVQADFPQYIYGDQQRLTQVVTNLLSNAVKFTDSGGVMLLVRCEGDTHWLLQVRDTGIGISAEDQAFIFDEFRQVDGSMQRRHGGTGLGLAIVQRVVRLMGGEISVDSAVGEGSTFSVKLPLQLADDSDFGDLLDLVDEAALLAAYKAQTSDA